jgi:hypothetical protein
MLVLVLAVLSLRAFGLYDALHLGQIQELVAAIALVEVMVILGSSVPYLNQILSQAQAEPQAP